MKVTVNIGWLIFFALLLIVATHYISDYLNEPQDTVTKKSKSDYNIVTFKLPKNPNPDVFGPSYWKALHTLVEMVPCPACRYKAVPFMKFFHDVVNLNTGKKLFDEKNYNFWIDYFNKKKEKV